jgi:hypothetical protein
MSVSRFGTSASNKSSASFDGVTKTYVHNNFLETTVDENIDLNNSYKVINSTNPINDQDLTTKSYVDDVLLAATLSFAINHNTNKHSGSTLSKHNNTNYSVLLTIAVLHSTKIINLTTDQLVSIQEKFSFDIKEMYELFLSEVETAKEIIVADANQDRKNKEEILSRSVQSTDDSARPK